MTSILFINYEYPPIGAGAANANYHFAINMAKNGFRTSVLTSAYKSRRGRTVEEGVVVYRIPAFRRHAGHSSLPQMLMYQLSAVLHLPSVIKHEQPDAAVVFFSFPCGPVGLLARLIWKIPYMVMLRGGDVPGFVPSLNRFHHFLSHIRRSVYKHSSAIIANSEGLRDLALKTDPDFHITIIANGVDTDFFSPDRHPTDNHGDFVILYTGRFCEQKNIGTLITAFSNFRSVHSESRLVLLGEGPSERHLKTHAEKLGISDHLTWVAWQSKEGIRSFYRSSHCFVNPSSYEGMSNAVLEAMACGLPVLGGDCIGNRAIIVDGENGFLCAPRDTAHLSQQMILLCTNRDYAHTLGMNGRKMCCERFSWPAAANRLSTLIETKYKATYRHDW